METGVLEGGVECGEKGTVAGWVKNEVKGSICKHTSTLMLAAEMELSLFPVKGLMQTGCKQLLRETPQTPEK